MSRQDLAWEALVEETRANPDFERGRIAAALGSIRACCQRDGILEEDVPGEIRARAAAYRVLWPYLTMTPTALARHWYRVLPQKGDSLVDKWKERHGDEGRNG